MYRAAPPPLTAWFIPRIRIADGDIKLACKHAGHVVHARTEKHCIVKCAMRFAV